MAELLPALGSLGGGGALVMVVIYLLGSNRTDRKEAREAIADAERRADAAEERRLAAERRYDEAIAARRQAEDRVADLEREVRRLGGGS